MRTLDSLAIVALFGSGLIAAPATPVPTRPLEVLRLLRARDFAPVTRAIEQKQAAVERDIRQERELAILIDTFDNADPKLTTLLDDWVRTTPDSFAPKLARAVHRIALAWNRRGTKYANKTTDEQFEGMETFLVAAVEDAHAVISINPRVVEAHRVVIKAAMAFGDQEACAKAATLGVAGLPASLRVRTALAHCFLPRWGGSYRLLQELAKEADEHLAENPRLAVLHGYIDWDQGNLADSGTDEEMQHYNRAVAAGDYLPYYRDRALAHVRNQHYVEALADTARALELSPDDPETLLIRARALEWSNRHAEAVAAAKLADEIDPSSKKLADFRRREAKSGAVEGHRLYSASDYPGAIARFTRAIELAGGTAELHYWRGRTYLMLKDNDHALTDFETAIQLDARNFESYRNVDFILAGRGNWDRIIQYWTAYIAVEPVDGRAYFERGGAKYHKGDRDSAFNDARKACQLAHQEACDFLRQRGIQ